MSDTADQSHSEVHTYYCDCSAEAQDENLCDTCSQVNLDELLDCSNLTPLGPPKTVFRLGHIAGSRCALCQFLRACLPQETLETKDVLDKYRLKVDLASTLFGTLVLRLTEVPALYIHEHNSHRRSPIGSRSILLVHKAPTIAGRHVKNEADVSTIAGWLETCNEFHSQCKHDPGQPIHDLIPGLQFIDCHTMKIVPAASTQYATLSYVWGSHLNVASYAPNETIDVMPKVIEDTALLVRKLGIRYLWVDRYCIPQNDTAAKHCQISSMGDIYGQSTLTVISAAGSDPSQGLPGVTSVSRNPSPEIRLGNHCFIGFLSPAFEISRSTWNKRGWTYQEAILSKRRLIFTESQVLFDCLGFHSTDCVSVPHSAFYLRRCVDSKRLNFGRSFPSSLDLGDPRTVLDLINNYRKRDLSFDDDALHAMAGIFAAFRKLEQPVQFVYGLPIFCKGLVRADTRQRVLLDALSWDETALRRRHQFPSWTWLGWKRPGDEKSSGLAAYSSYDRFLPFGQFRLYRRLFPGIAAKFEYRDGMVLDWETSYASVLELDSQSHHPTRLRLTGWTFRGKVCWNGSWRFVAPVACLRTAHRNSLHLFHKSNVGEDASSCDVLAIILQTRRRCWIHTLLFRKIHGDNVYERIGYDRWSLNNDDSYEFIISPDSKHAAFGDLELEWAEIVIV